MNAILLDYMDGFEYLPFEETKMIVLDILLLGCQQFFKEFKYVIRGWPGNLIL